MQRFSKAPALAIALLLIPLWVLAADPLWTRAVQTYADHAELIPGTMVIRFDQYNNRGKLVSSNETVLSIELNDDGEVHSRVVTATTNGEEMTDERGRSGGPGPAFGDPTQDDAGEGGADAFSDLRRSPFDPVEQGNVIVTRLSGLDEIDGTIVQAFAFEHHTDARRVNRGTAWLDPTTGDPVLLRLTMDPLPRFVSELVMTQRYGRDADGRWIVERMEFAGEGGVLFFRRRVESVFIFSEYFRTP